jgi:hypothetical protein
VLSPWPSPYINSSSLWSSFLLCFFLPQPPPSSAAQRCLRQAISGKGNHVNSFASLPHTSSAALTSQFRPEVPARPSPSQSPVIGHHRATARGQPSPLPLHVFQLHHYARDELLLLLVPSILAVTGLCRRSTA